MYKIPTLKYFWAAVWTFPTVAANNSSAVKLFTAGADVSAHCSAQARRVDSVEGGSVMFWEVFFSAGGGNMCAEGASL